MKRLALLYQMVFGTAPEVCDHEHQCASLCVSCGEDVCQLCAEIWAVDGDVGQETVYAVCKPCQGDM